jgi:hypothetical protein
MHKANGRAVLDELIEIPWTDRQEAALRILIRPFDAVPLDSHRAGV